MQGLVLANVLAAAYESSDGNWSLIGLLFFLSGFIFYGYVFLRYRNADKRFQHESRTRSVRANMQMRDERVRSLKDLHHSKMKGANNHAVRGSHNPIAGLMGAADQGSAKAVMDQVMRFRPDK